MTAHVLAANGSFTGGGPTVEENPGMHETPDERLYAQWMERAREINRAKRESKLLDEKYAAMLEEYTEQVMAPLHEFDDDIAEMRAIDGR